MNMDDEEYSPFAFGSGCDIHGEDYMSECSMCGIEFCTACFPNSNLCPDCAAQLEFDLDDDEENGEDLDMELLSEFNDDEPTDLMENPAPVKSRAKAARNAGQKPGTSASPKTKTAVRPKPKAAAKPKPKAKAARKSKP